MTKEKKPIGLYCIKTRLYVCVYRKDREFCDATKGESPSIYSLIGTLIMDINYASNTLDLHLVFSRILLVKIPIFLEH